MSRPRTGWLGKAGRLGLGLLLACLIVEGGLRLIELSPLRWVLPAVQVSLYGPDPFTGYVHRPGAEGLWLTENRAHVRINDLGLRDAPMTLRPPEGVRRIGLFGASVMEALQVPEPATHQAIAERRLAADGGPPVQIANLGLAGANLAVMAERFIHHAPGLDLDGALFMFSGGELIARPPSDDSAYADYLPDGKGGFTVGHGFREGRGYRLRASRAGDMLYWLVDNVRLVGLLNDRKNEGFLKISRTMGKVAPPEDACSRVARQLARYRSALIDPSDPDVEARNRRFLKDVATTAKTRAIPVVVAAYGIPLIPEGCPARLTQARTQVVQTLRRTFAVHDLPLVDVGAELADLGVTARTMPALRGFGAQLGVGHLNLHGNALFGRVMADIVRDRLVPPATPR